MNRRDVWILFIILILVLIGYIYPLVYSFQEHESVTIFVIDTFDQSMLSHGEVVTSIIEQQVPQFNIKRLNVKEKEHYGISKYYQALDQIYNYKLQNTQEKVIVNISLGFYESEEYHQLLIERLAELGVGVVAAAGNDDSPIAFYPAAYEDEVIAVASIKGDQKTDYSNYGEYIDICAEGSFFTTISLPQFFSYRASGTSFAAPRVSAFLSKIMASQKDMNLDKAVERLNQLTTPLDDELFEKGLLGKGKISNWKFLFNYNKVKLLYFYLLPGIVFLLIFYLLIKKVGLIAVPYLLLLLIVLGPFFIFMRDYFLRSLTHQIITLENLRLTLVFILSYLVVKILTSFEKYYLFIIYFVINSAAAAIMYFTNLLDLYNYIIISMIMVILFYSYEYYLYRNKKDSQEIKDLETNSYKVLNKVRSNIIDKVVFNEEKLNEIFTRYQITGKNHVKKAIIDVLLARLKHIPFGFLYKNSESIIVKNYLFNIIKENKEQIPVKELFEALKEDAYYIDRLFAAYSFDEIGEQLISEFGKRDININILIKVINYYNDSSIVDYLISIYDNYEKCWHRYLLAKTILRLADDKKRKELVKEFINDNCGLVKEEAHYYRKKEGYSIG